MKHTTITIYGTLGGEIWMPAAVCRKTFRYSSDDSQFGCNRYSDGSRPTLREIILEITNDGDFQNASIADATVMVERRTDTRTGSMTRRRSWDIRKFQSVADCVVEEGSEKYWEIMDCFADAE